MRSLPVSQLRELGGAALAYASRLPNTERGQSVPSADFWMPSAQPAAAAHLQPGYGPAYGAEQQPSTPSGLRSQLSGVSSLHSSSASHTRGPSRTPSDLSYLREGRRASIPAPAASLASLPVDWGSMTPPGSTLRLGGEAGSNAAASFAAFQAQTRSRAPSVTSHADTSQVFSDSSPGTPRSPACPPYAAYPDTARSEYGEHSSRWPPAVLPAGPGRPVVPPLPLGRVALGVPVAREERRPSTAASAPGSTVASTPRRHAGSVMEALDEAARHIETAARLATPRGTPRATGDSIAELTGTRELRPMSPESARLQASLSQVSQNLLTAQSHLPNSRRGSMGVDIWTAEAGAPAIQNSRPHLQAAGAASIRQPTLAAQQPYSAAAGPSPARPAAARPLLVPAAPREADFPPAEATLAGAAHLTTPSERAWEASSCATSPSEQSASLRSPVLDEATSSNTAVAPTPRPLGFSWGRDALRCGYNPPSPSAHAPAAASPAVSRPAPGAPTLPPGPAADHAQGQAPLQHVQLAAGGHHAQPPGTQPGVSAPQQAAGAGASVLSQCAPASALPAQSDSGAANADTHARGSAPQAAAEPAAPAAAEPGSAAGLAAAPTEPSASPLVPLDWHNGGPADPQPSSVPEPPNLPVAAPASAANEPPTHQPTPHQPQPAAPNARPAVPSPPVSKPHLLECTGSEQQASDLPAQLSASAHMNDQRPAAPAGAGRPALETEQGSLPGTPTPLPSTPAHGAFSSTAGVRSCPPGALSPCSDGTSQVEQSPAAQPAGSPPPPSCSTRLFDSPAPLPAPMGALGATTAASAAAGTAASPAAAVSQRMRADSPQPELSFGRLSADSDASTPSPIKRHLSSAKADSPWMDSLQQFLATPSSSPSAQWPLLASPQAAVGAGAAPAAPSGAAASPLRAPPPVRTHPVAGLAGSPGGSPARPAAAGSSSPLHPPPPFSPMRTHPLAFLNALKEPLSPMGPGSSPPPSASPAGTRRASAPLVAAHVAEQPLRAVYSPQARRVSAPAADHTGSPFASSSPAQLAAGASGHSPEPRPERRAAPAAAAPSPKAKRCLQELASPAPASARPPPVSSPAAPAPPVAVAADCSASQCPVPPAHQQAVAVEQGGASHACTSMQRPSQLRQRSSQDSARQRAGEAGAALADNSWCIRAVGHAEPPAAPAADATPPGAEQEATQQPPALQAANKLKIKVQPSSKAPPAGHAGAKRSQPVWRSLLSVLLLLVLLAGPGVYVARQYPPSRAHADAIMHSAQQASSWAAGQAAARYQASKDWGATQARQLVQRLPAKSSFQQAAGELAAHLRALPASGQAVLACAQPGWAAAKLQAVAAANGLKQQLLLWRAQLAASQAGLAAAVPQEARDQAAQLLASLTRAWPGLQAWRRAPQAAPWHYQLWAPAWLTAPGIRRFAVLCCGLPHRLGHALAAYHLAPDAATQATVPALKLARLPSPVTPSAKSPAPAQRVAAAGSPAEQPAAPRLAVPLHGAYLDNAAAVLGKQAAAQVRRAAPAPGAAAGALPVQHDATQQPAHGVGQDAAAQGSSEQVATATAAALSVADKLSLVPPEAVGRQEAAAALQPSGSSVEVDTTLGNAQLANQQAAPLTVAGEPAALAGGGAVSLPASTSAAVSLPAAPDQNDLAAAPAPAVTAGPSQEHLHVPAVLEVPSSEAAEPQEVPEQPAVPAELATSAPDSRAAQLHMAGTHQAVGHGADIAVSLAPDDGAQGRVQAGDSERSAAAAEGTRPEAEQPGSSDAQQQPAAAEVHGEQPAPGAQEAAAERAASAEPSVQEAATAEPVTLVPSSDAAWGAPEQLPGTGVAVPAAVSPETAVPEVAGWSWDALKTAARVQLQQPAAARLPPAVPAAAPSGSVAAVPVPISSLPVAALQPRSRAQRAAARLLRPLTLATCWAALAARWAASWLLPIGAVPPLALLALAAVASLAAAVWVTVGPLRLQLLLHKAVAMAAAIAAKPIHVGTSDGADNDAPLPLANDAQEAELADEGSHMRTRSFRRASEPLTAARPPRGVASQDGAAATARATRARSRRTSAAGAASGSMPAGETEAAAGVAVSHGAPAAARAMARGASQAYSDFTWLRPNQPCPRSSPRRTRSESGGRDGSGDLTYRWLRNRTVVALDSEQEEAVAHSAEVAALGRQLSANSPMATSLAAAAQRRRSSRLPAASGSSTPSVPESF